MTQCEYCGNNVRERHDFCPTCGAKVNHPPKPDPPPRPATPPPPRTATPAPGAPVAPQHRTAAVAAVCAAVLLVSMVLLLSTSSGKGTAQGGSGTVAVEPAPVDPGLHDAMRGRLDADPLDREALLYLVTYYLHGEQPFDARVCVEDFLAGEVRDDSGVYLELAERFRDAGQPQVAVQVLRRGQELTRSSTLGEALAGYRPADLVDDALLRQALELMFGKGIGNITFDDILSIRGLAVTGNGDVLHFTQAQPVIEDGRVVNLEEFLAGMEQRVVLDGHLWYYEPLALFDNLSYLRVDDLYGEPEALLNLYHLEWLDLRAAGRAEEITALPPFPELRMLDLAGGGVKSLAGLRELDMLEHLGLTKTEVADLGALAAMEGMRSLALEKNENLTSLSGLEGMHWMRDVSVVSMDLVELNALSGMTGLERLTVADTAVRNLDFLPALTGLRALALRGNADLRSLPSLAPLEQLEELTISCNRFENSRDLDFLQDMRSLRRLQLLSAGDISPVSGMPLLEELTITHYSAEGFAAIASATGLKRLTIGSASSATTPTASVDLSFLAALAELEYLDLNGAAGFLRGTGALFGLEQLVYLDLSNNSFEGDFSGVGRLQNLKTLRLDKVRFTGPVRESYDGFFHYVDYDTLPIESYLPAVGELAGLETLSVANNKLDTLDFAAGLEGLTALYAADNYITSVEPLAGLDRLALLDLRDNPVADWWALDGRPLRRLDLE